MTQSKQGFPVIAVTAVVLGMAAVAVAIWYTVSMFAFDSRRMGGATQAVAGLLRLQRAMGQYRIEAYRDADGDGQGEYPELPALLDAGLVEAEFTAMHGGLQRGGYLYQAVLPGEVDQREVMCVVVALPAEQGWPVMAVDQDGIVRIAPADFTPDPQAPVDPSAWAVWSQ